MAKRMAKELLATFLFYILIKFDSCGSGDISLIIGNNFAPVTLLG